MIEIKLRDALQKGQDYVAGLSEKLGIDIKAFRHDIETDTCFEKAKLLGWNPEQVVKTIFFSREPDVYGFVFPELGKDSPIRVNTKEILPEILGISNKQAKDFKNSYCPYGMEFGTCTPFVLEDSFERTNMGRLLRKIFFHEMLDDFLSDISIGGIGEEARKTSLHLKYSDIYNVLYAKFGDKIKRLNIFKK